METRVYILDFEIAQGMTNQEFIETAEKYGNVYSLKGFENAFNNTDEINPFTQIIKIVG